MYSRGAVECVRVLGSDEPGETLSTKVVQSLPATYERLRECAGVFTQLGYGEHAAEAHKECAYFLRSVAPHLKQSSTGTTNVIHYELSHNVEKKLKFLFDGVYRWGIYQQNKIENCFESNFTFKLLKKKNPTNINTCTVYRYERLDNIPQMYKQ